MCNYTQFFVNRQLPSCQKKVCFHALSKTVNYLIILATGLNTVTAFVSNYITEQNEWNKGVINRKNVNG